MIWEMPLNAGSWSLCGFFCRDTFKTGPMIKCPDILERSKPATLHRSAKSKILRVLPTGRAWFLGEVRYQYGVGGAKSLGVPSVFDWTSEDVMFICLVRC